jgi:isochorismate synthase
LKVVLTKTVLMIKLRQYDVFALYSLPYSTEHFLIRQMDNNITQFNSKSLQQQGFVIHPFKEDKSCPAVFIRQDKLHKNPIIHFTSNHRGTVRSIDREQYLEQVQDFIEATQQDYKKIIFSRIETVNLETGDLFQLFNTLKELYPNTFVYLFNLPGIGCWMGASPEIFVSQKGNNYETVALAGTQRNLGIPLENVFWGEKEIEEQAIVERYVEEKLQQQKVNYQKTVPYTSQAGKLLHLKTKFRFRPTSDLFKFLKVLHPTPAVCGIPKQAATDFILHHEAHKRAYYSGFLGPINIEGESNLYVNLRCMQVFKDKFALYVGGGITADSNGEKEWEETEIKSQTMADVIERIYAGSLMV